MFMSSVIAFCFVQRYISLTIVTAFMFSFINLNYFRDPLLIVLHFSLPFYFFFNKAIRHGIRYGKQTPLSGRYNSFCYTFGLLCLLVLHLFLHHIIHLLFPLVGHSPAPTPFVWLVVHHLLHPLFGRTPPPKPYQLLHGFLLLLFSITTALTRILRLPASLFSFLLVHPERYASTGVWKVFIL